MPISSNKQIQKDKSTTAQIIESLLTEVPTLRDDDERLVSNTLYKFIKDLGYNPNEIAASVLLRLYSEGKLPTVDYITRLRRKIQEERIDLRGDRYNKRQSKGGQIKKEINQSRPDTVF